MIIGTAGHIDHGKTALVRALTGVDTDRLKEEKARGISIDLGFAYKQTPAGHRLGFVDVPGHERFVHTMLAGASGIDYVILVIAADDGVMPQTREHLAIIGLLGITRGVVALSKADLVTPERLAAATAEVRTALAGSALSNADIIPVSAVTGQGLAELDARLAEEAARAIDRQSSGRFRMTVDRCFTLHGAGTVVTGTVLSGSVSVGDHLMVSPAGLAVRVRAIHAHNQPSEQGRAGERCALNLTGDHVDRHAIARGDVVLDPALHAPTARLDATLRVLSSETKPIGQWFPVRFHTAATEVGARIVLLGDGPIAPGQDAFVQLVLEHPVAATVGDRFVIRDVSAQRSIGGGQIVDLRGPTRKRRSLQRHAELAARSLTAPGEALEALLALPPHLVDLDAFARDRALSDTQAQDLVDRQNLIRIQADGQQLALTDDNWQRQRQSVTESLAAFHHDHPDVPGIGREQLRSQSAPLFPRSAFCAMLRSMAQAGVIAFDGAWVRLGTHEVRLTPADEALWATVRPLLAEADRFRPPRVRDIAGLIGVPEETVRRHLKQAERFGFVDEVAHDRFFLRTAVTEMVGIVCRLAATSPQAQFTASQFRDEVESGRKVAIQTLEFFDRHGVTVRRGDLRHVNRHRLDLFSPPS
jgi:selenocysteine-specific elongation factor